MSRLILNFVRPALVIFAVAYLPGCAVNGGGDGEATTVEFPESDEQLIIVDEPGTAGLIVSGDSATGDVTRMAVSRADGTVTAKFDDQGRPTSVDINVDSVVLFDITYNDDGPPFPFDEFPAERDLTVPATRNID